MKIDPLLLADIQTAEKCVLTSYRDTNGFWTIGWGHKLGGDPAWNGWRDLVWTQAKADEQLATDIAEAVKNVDTLGEWLAVSDNRARRNTVIELVFNMGLTKWRTFTKTRALLTQKNWTAAAVELTDSLWFQQVGKIRGNRLAGYLGLGCYPPSAAGNSLSAVWSSAWPPGYVLEDSSPAATGSVQ